MSGLFVEHVESCDYCLSQEELHAEGKITYDEMGERQYRCYSEYYRDLADMRGDE